ncbi:MAG: hypothetical protein AAF570_19925, partial [Bacteroidota bacterium]
MQGPQADQEIAGADMVYYNNRSAAPAFIRLRPEAHIEAKQGEAWLRGVLGMRAEDDFRLLESFDDQLGMQHFRLQQTYKGLPVEGSMYIIHTRNGKVVSVNGEYYPNLEMDVNP